MAYPNLQVLFFFFFFFFLVSSSGPHRPVTCACSALNVRPKTHDRVLPAGCADNPSQDGDRSDEEEADREHTHNKDPQARATGRDGRDECARTEDVASM
ncbi:hypothetical protein OOU_Y34scaffold00726g74 [Pyricularia oryzae Y34]|uniref:Secreted protein n=1 Tax=Pyricularia oryzae (strain Y34) TaxID=1143189 RepID=A0AA97NRV5_PYRO3|nr:hypothetical protein OOU_Y34scaffold00726g74 [Pyricularia oryzae Y34]